MKKLVVFFIFLSFLEVRAQAVKVLVLSSQNNFEIKFKLKKYAFENNVHLDFQEKISTENINEISAVLLLDFDENLLDIKQNNLLVNFLKNGGGLMACGFTVKEKYRWNWIGNALGFKKNVPNEIFSGEIITLKSVGGTDQLPIWTLDNSKMSGFKPAKNLNPVLMDFSGNNLAWTGQSENGGKIFYTVFTPDTINLQNQNFRKHFFGGLLSVFNSKNQLEKIESTLPLESQFKMDTLIKVPKEVHKILLLPDEKLLLIAKNDSVLVFDQKNSTMQNLGITPGIGEALGLSLDPEFLANQSLYAYFRDTSTTFLAKKLKLNSQLYWDDFQAASSLPVFNSFFARPDSSHAKNFFFPEYYFGKRIYLNSENGISVDTYIGNSDLVSTEPFVFNSLDGKISSFVFSPSGIMYFLVNEYIMEVEFNKEGRFMQAPMFDFVSISQKSGMSKVDLKVKNPDSGYKYFWEINGKKFEGENVNFLQKKKSKIVVMLSSISASGKKLTKTETLDIN